ncbi:MAG: hypothetical protein WEA99_10015 [Brumimicrobium sp.]
MVSFDSFGQEFTPITDSLSLNKFHSNVKNILETNRDSFIPDTLENRYKIKYRTSCQYNEILYNRTNTSLGIQISSETQGKSFIDRPFVTDTIKEANYSFYFCAEKPSISKDLKSYQIFKDSTSITKNAITTDIMINTFITIKNKPKWVAISYCNYKFLILEQSIIRNVGSLTSSGITETLILERIE